MARQHTLSKHKSIVGAALVGLGFVILFGKLDGPAAQRHSYWMLSRIKSRHAETKNSSKKK